MKSHNSTSPPRYGKLVAVAALLGLVSQGTLAAQQGTPSGTTITNLSTLSYSVGGAAQTAIGSAPTGNTAGAGTATTFKVDKKVNLTVVKSDATIVSVVPGQISAVTTFSVTNLGNDAQDFALVAANIATGQTLFTTKSDNFDTTGLQVFVESGLHAGYQAGEDTAVFIDELASGDSKTVYVLATIPIAQVNADVALVSLTATAKIGGTAGGAIGGALLETTGADTLGSVDIVFADGAGSDDAARDAAFSARDAYLVNSSVITVTKTVVPLCDPLNGIVNPKNIPGALVTYSITVGNGAGSAASAVLTTITDTLDANVTHDPGLRAPSNAATCIVGTSTSGFRIASTTPNNRGVGGTAGVMTNASDNDGATIAVRAVTIDFAKALPAGTYNSVGYLDGELKPGESATITYNAIVN